MFLPSQLPLRRRVVDAGESREVGAERLLQLVPGPDVGQPLLMLGVGVEARGEAAAGKPHLAQEPTDRLVDSRPKQMAHRLR